MNHLLAIGTLANMELLMVFVLFAPFVVMRQAPFKRQEPPHE